MLDSTECNGNFSSVSSMEEISQSRDIDAENRLIATLRLTCKLCPGYLVKDLDTRGVMSLHLMRSLSPGDINVAELVCKLANLTELDLSGNLLGPQGFRVVCLALSRNTTLKVLNLANNLADTDSSVSIHVNSVVFHLRSQGRGFIISMHLYKEYARSATTNTDNTRNIYERLKYSFLQHYSYFIQIVWHKNHVYSVKWALSARSLSL